MNTSPTIKLRIATGGLFAISALAFAAAATALSVMFDWPDVLREPAEVVLPAFTAGGPALVWAWFAAAWTYGLLAIPILLLPAALDLQGNHVVKIATYAGAASVVLSLIGFLRWVFVVPALASTYATGDGQTRAAVAAAWTAQHQFGGALLGEHLGQLLVIGWSAAVSVMILPRGFLPRWIGAAGLITSSIYLLNQGDILATAVPGFPVWDLAGLIGSTGWGLWIAALGISILIKRSAVDSPAPVTHFRPALHGMA
ncbi:DUF4386 domain-containing protein [Arthrobacter sp. Z1-9]